MALNPAQLAHGPMFIGGVLTILLFGISITQVYIYWDSYRKKDRWWIKAYVLTILLADTVHTVFIVVYLYQSLVLNFGNVVFLATSTTMFETGTVLLCLRVGIPHLRAFELLPEPALSGMISGMVQSFFGWRVKVLTQSWILFIIIELCSFAVFLMGIATAIACHMVGQFADFQKFRVVVIIWLASATFADVLITGVLVAYLRKHRTGFKTTDSQIDRIIRLTMQTGLVTAIWAFADLMVYLLDPTGMHLLLNCLLPKLYTNSLMSSLNSRGGWKYSDTETGKTQSRSEYGLQRMGADTQVVNLGTIASTRPEVFVHVDSESHSDHLKGSADGMYSEWTDTKNQGRDAV